MWGVPLDSCLKKGSELLSDTWKLNLIKQCKRHDGRFEKKQGWVKHCIMGEEVEFAEVNKYLIVHLERRLDCRLNSEGIYKKGQSKLYFLRLQQDAAYIP